MRADLIGGDTVRSNETTAHSRDPQAMAVVGERFARVGPDSHDADGAHHQRHCDLDGNQAGSHDCDERCGTSPSGAEDGEEGEVVHLDREQDDADHDPGDEHA